MTEQGRAALIELGGRYAALGLATAARGALLRAHRAAPDGDTDAARQLVELAIATGDGDAARALAEEVVRRERGPAARLLLGRAQLEAGALDAARLALAGALEAAGADHPLRARAHVGLARVAAAQGDRAGAGANAMAALDELLLGAAGDEGGFDDDLPVAEEAIKRAVGCDRGADVLDSLAQFAEATPVGPHHVLCAVTLAAQQSRGEPEIRDADIEAALGRELAAHPDSRATRLYLAERRLFHAVRDANVRREVVAELEQLAVELAGAPSAALARVHRMLATVHAGDPAGLARAEEAYRAALALRPGDADAAAALALMGLSRGDADAALDDAVRAVRAGGPGRGAWRTAARVVAATHGLDADDAVTRLIETVAPGAAPATTDAAARLLAAAAEVAREESLAGVHARGHRLKNLLGIIGARVRSARKVAGPDVAGRLADLEREVTGLYDEWATYLRSLQQPSAAVIELVAVAPLVDEVVRAARERSAAIIDVAVDDGLPELRGDRLQLREALLNVVHNAAEACEGSDGRVRVVARAVRSGGAPLVEIEIADSGPGIPRADLARIFSPGFTTKESGSGVGLVIAERVVASHHGRILVDSEVGAGTRVSLMLPSDLGGFAGLASFPVLPGGGRR